jgi:trimeric autotransporter adhesin
MNGDIKGAFLSDTDDTDLVGSGELVTNGTFDTDTTGWSNTSATIASVSGELQVSNQTDSPSATTQTVSGLVVGKVYAVTATYSQTGTGGTAARVSFFGILSENNSTSTPVTKTIYATATQTTATLSLQSFGTSSTISHFDNVSVKLADADRSVNNKGLIVNGTVTRTAVATGADLVAYSGFSASNYLEQPYNSALDFGTGDFSVMGWVRVTDGVLSRTVLSRRGSNNALQVIFDLSDDKLKLVISNNSFSSSDTVSSNALPISQWVYFCGVRSGSTLLFYQNGSLTGTTAITNATGSLSEADATLEVGHRQDNVIPFTNGSLALLRISATAPTAEQIAKIYNDEKFLFQDNAQATLYGASDAVTALAHDDATNLLHVGTSAGRSVFQGLRRVENTTTAVGTAISASNSLVVEE